MPILLEIALRTTAIYLALLVGLRLIGRGEAAQLRTVDLVLLLVLANAVQNAMLGPDTSLAGGLVAAGTLLVLARAFRIVEGAFPALRRSIEGEPILLARHGRLLPRGLARAGLGGQDVLVAARRAGIGSLAKVELAILEADGGVSVVGGTAPRRRSRAVRAPRRAR